MALKLKNNKWITYPEDEEVQFLIKPFSVLFLTNLPTNENLSPEMLWDNFNATVVDWKGITDADGKTLKCNKDNKRFIAEQFQDILMFVFNESNKMNQRLEEETKN